MDSYYIYKHTNNINGKVYIGCTKMQPCNRWKNGNGYTSGTLKTAIQKYGWDNFKHEILFDNLSKSEAYRKEKELIELYKSNVSEYGYNRSCGGEKSALGYKHTTEAKMKIGRAAKKTLTGRKFAPEHRQHLKDNHADFNGEKSALSKLTQIQVDEIRTLYIPHSKTFGRNALAKKYNVSKSTVQLIVSNKTWKNSRI